MKYYVVKFTMTAAPELMQDARDTLAAVAVEAGFETFEETPEGTNGYVQQQLFDEEALKSALAFFPFEDVKVAYTVEEAEDRDWNEQWEQEGFEPILVEGGESGAAKDMRSSILIHDGRHIPSTLRQPSITIEIDAKLAFGTGTHETTRMVCSTLLDMAVDGKHVLDCGSGTGILGITAMKLGAAECVAYDIDEWSVDNTRHNAVINQVEVTPLLGDATILNKVEGVFGIVMANINRNILLQDMPMFRTKMAAGACLILSGFYTEDIPLLTSKAGELGLSLKSQKEDNGWACIVLE